jgi:hypothetical protein
VCLKVKVSICFCNVTGKGKSESKFAPVLNSGKLLINSNCNKIRRRLVYGLDDRWFESRQGLGIFLFTTAPRTALGPTQPPITRVRGARSVGVKRPGRKAYHSLPSSADVKNALSYTSTAQRCLHGVVLS